MYAIRSYYDRAVDERDREDARADRDRNLRDPQRNGDEARRQVAELIALHHQFRGVIREVAAHPRSGEADERGEESYNFV